MGVTLKLATSLDGRIATATGQSRWITGPEARQAAHGLRAEHDAVLVGVETALADDPELTVRIEGFAGRQPTRVVLDSRQRLSPLSKLCSTARETPTLIVTTTEALPTLLACGVEVLRIAPGPDGRPDLQAALAALATRGLGRVFVEGGGQVAAGFLRAGLVGRLEWFRAPMLLGGEGRPAVGTLAAGDLADAPRFSRTHIRTVGDDLWESYERL